MICILDEKDLYRVIDESLTFHLAGKLGLSMHAKTAGQVSDVARNVAHAVVMASESVTSLPSGPISRDRSPADFYFLLFRGLDDAIADFAIASELAPAQHENLRTLASMLCGVMAGALDGEKTRESSPEYAAQVAARLVQTLREMPRSS